MRTDIQTPTKEKNLRFFTESRVKKKSMLDVWPTETMHSLMCYQKERTLVCKLHTTHPNKSLLLWKQHLTDENFIGNQKT